MKIEEEIFRKETINPAKLVSYGFQKDGSTYIYRKLFMNDKLEAVVTADENGQIKGQIIDKLSNEEYLPIRIESSIGAFVGNAREEYKEILRDIAENCCTTRPFISQQANRLSDLIYARYRESPDYPFKKLSDYGVFRYPTNRKWYALIMNIKRSLLCGDDEERIDIVNLRVYPEEFDKSLKVQGIYPAYHMKKTTWVSITLDDTLSDEEIMGYIDMSRNMAIGSDKRSGRALSMNHWVIPANPKYYDVEKAFKGTDVIEWKQSCNVKVGDIVYLYLAAPVSSVKYECVVTETGIPFDYKDENITIKNLMKIKRIRTFRKGTIGIKKVREMGVRNVQGPRKATPELIDFINEKG